MNILIDFTKEYGLDIIHTIVMGVFSYIALDMKKVHKKREQDKIKKEVVRMVCKYVNEIYPSISISDKLEEASDGIREILKEKGISISDLELKVLLHNSIYEINNELEVKT